MSEEHPQILFLLSQFMIGGELTRLMRLYVLLRASVVRIVKHMLGELRVELVVGHRCQGRDVLEVTLLHAQVHGVILVKHLSQTL